MCTSQLLTVFDIQADNKDDNSKNGSNNTNDDIDDVSNTSNTDDNHDDDKTTNQDDTESRIKSETESKTAPNAEPEGKDIPSDKVSKHTVYIHVLLLCVRWRIANPNACV
jgi:hypothetical protein